ncbi:UNVERIFIED_CONTAM: cytochrome [Sesamum calycinum]|uniref:Cytochrome n=1 Tax=Sesamum calycinum TaxID=2727403 RepID=A0AAW2J8C4_9LAMI
METLLSSLALISCAVALVYAWRILNWVWLRPRKLEKILRQQGFKGNSYKLFFGDFNEMKTMTKEAKSKPMTFSHENCEQSFLWFGPRPAVIVLDPELIREILSKSYIFQKLGGNPITRMLARGIASYETDKWAKHRRLINPAFHVEKLKHMVPAFYLSCADMLSKWEKIVPSEGSCELDVWPYLQTLTSDAISRTAFGSSYEEGRRIFELQKEQAERIMEALRTVYIPGSRCD